MRLTWTRRAGMLRWDGTAAADPYRIEARIWWEDGYGVDVDVWQGRQWIGDSGVPAVSLLAAKRAARRLALEIVERAGA